MRFNNKHELKNYLSNKRISVIQKAHKNTHNRIQFTNNRLIDKKILEWNNEIDEDIYDPYNPELLQVKSQHIIELLQVKICSVYLDIVL